MEELTMIHITKKAKRKLKMQAVKEGISMIELLERLIQENI